MAAAAPRGTVCLTFDNMGAALQVGRRERATPDLDEPGLRYGYPALLAMLSEIGVKGTFFIEGWNALHHSDRVAALVEAGHEVAAHGWVHESFSGLDAIDTERVIVDALAAFRTIGIKPTGFRAPGGRRSLTQTEVLSRLGFRFDSSLEHRPEDDPVCDKPYYLGDGLVNLPWCLQQIDNYHFAEARADRDGGPLTPDDFAKYWCSLVDETAANGSVLTLIVHAAVTGIDPARVEALRKVLSYAIEHPGADVCTAGSYVTSITHH